MTTPREDALLHVANAAVRLSDKRTADNDGYWVSAREMRYLDEALDALAAAPKVESVRAASERLGIPIGHVRDYPHRFAPFEDDGLVQRGHVPCCWCGEHHEEGR